MNNAILNAELALAVRKCLPFVLEHAVLSGGEGSATYAFSLRALADYDARRAREEAAQHPVLHDYRLGQRCKCDICTKFRKSRSI